MTLRSLLDAPGAPFSDAQRAWVDGFLTALALQPPEPADDRPVAHVLYGSQTGNAHGLAEDLAAGLDAAGLAAHVEELDAVDVGTLTERSLLLVITSTYGEGEMPDNAELFWKALQEHEGSLQGVSFGVLALGDTGYDEFCAAGRLIDERLAALGATRVVDRADCDVDFDDPAEAWVAAACEAMASLAGTTAAAAPTRSRERSGWTRKNPFRTGLDANRRLSGDGSAKEIRHLEVALADSGITYEAGDALAVVPVNDPSLVSLLTDAVGGDDSLVDVLTREREIRTPSKDLVAAVAERSGDAELLHVLDGADPDALSAWLWGRDVLDLVQMCGGLGADELVGLLRPLQHRAYSISSSPLAHPDHVHLTTATVRHHRDGRDRTGVASAFLADRCTDDVGIFLQPNASFRLPTDDDVPVVMVGPGTGVAPFRAFCQEREARGASGRNWLFFGDQHREHDFIYADELLAWQESGVLDRLDLAFSRDQQHKVYVQTRMREQGRELFAWLEEGAHVYVCGDASRMARDVDDALHEVVAEHGGLSSDAAEDYVAQLRRAKRYLRDVY